MVLQLCRSRHRNCRACSPRPTSLPTRLWRSCWVSHRGWLCESWLSGLATWRLKNWQRKCCIGKTANRVQISVTLFPCSCTLAELCKWARCMLSSPAVTSSTWEWSIQLPRKKLWILTDLSTLQQHSMPPASEKWNFMQIPPVVRGYMQPLLNL